MSNFIFTFLHHLIYRFRAKTAHGVHSPFVYNLYQIIRKSSRHRIEKSENLRKELRKNHELIDLIDFKKKKHIRKTISNVVKYSTSQPKFSSFLFLLIDLIDAETVLETGTSLGVNTSYLCSSSARKVISIEASPILNQLAIRNLNSLESKKLHLIQGDIHEVFSPTIISHQPDLVFLDADHRGSTTIKLIEQLNNLAPNVKCIIVHDIYWSRDMNEAWLQLKSDSRFSLTIDIFQAGLIFPNMALPKQDFTLHF